MKLTQTFKVLGLIFLGFVLGIVATMMGLGFFLRHKLSKAVFNTAAGPEVADVVDHKRRLVKEREELAKANDQYRRWLAMTDLALLEVEHGSLVNAEEYGRELLRIAPAYKDDWNYGNAIHKANLALGHVALRNGKLSEAKMFLIEAGKTPGSPQLNSFGPNMTLAKELFNRGEKEVVLQYFDECDRFWEMGHDDLRNWKALVKDGIEPDFRANLSY